MRGFLMARSISRSEYRVEKDTKKAQTKEHKLFSAVAQKQLEAVEQLLACKADPNVRSTEGATLLHQAVFSLDTPIARALVHSKASVNAQDNQGVTALMLAVETDQVDLMNLLLHAKADVNSRSRAGETALIMASGAKRLRAVERLLLCSGLDLNVQSQQGLTALLVASDAGDDQVVSRLLAAKASLELKDEDDDTALLAAVGQGWTQVAQRLVEAGANVNARNAAGESVLELAQSTTGDAHRRKLQMLALQQEAENALDRAVRTYVERAECQQLSSRKACGVGSQQGISEGEHSEHKAVASLHQARPPAKLSTSAVDLNDSEHKALAKPKQVRPVAKLGTSEASEHAERKAAVAAKLQVGTSEADVNDAEHKALSKQARPGLCGRCGLGIAVVVCGRRACGHLCAPCNKRVHECASRRHRRAILDLPTNDVFSASAKQGVFTTSDNAEQEAEEEKEKEEEEEEEEEEEDEEKEEEVEEEGEETEGEEEEEKSLFLEKRRSKDARAGCVPTTRGRSNITPISRARATSGCEADNIDLSELEEVQVDRFPSAAELIQAMKAQQRAHLLERGKHREKLRALEGINQEMSHRLRQLNERFEKEKKLWKKEVAVAEKERLAKESAVLQTQERLERLSKNLERVHKEHQGEVQRLERKLHTLQAGREVEIQAERERGRQELLHGDTLHGLGTTALQDLSRHVGTLQQKILDEALRRKQCVVCLEEPACIVFLPCKHMKTCPDCSRRLETCPLCRTKIASKLKPFDS
eukprot:g79362.t1